MNLPKTANEQILIYVCLLGITLAAGMFALSVQGREDSLAFGSFERILIFILGGLFTALKLQPSANSLPNNKNNND